MEQNIIPEGYKQTEVGVIPGDWEITSIDEVSTLIGDGIHSTPVYDLNGSYYFVNGNNINKGKLKFNENTKKVNEAEFNKHKKKINERTLFLSINGTIGSLAYYNNEPIILGKSAAFINISREVCVTYMYHALSFDKTQQRFEDGLTGSTIKNLGLGTIRSTLIPFPKLKEQTAIANALSDVDALIASIEKLIAKKQAIKTATMQQLLTGKKRLPPFDIYQETDLAVIQGNKQIGQPKGTQQTELGEIPEDWAVETISSISAVPMQNGLFYEPSRKGQGISLINVGDMYKSAPIDVEQLELFNANIAEIKTFRVSSGDLFFTRSSIVPSGIAFCNIYESENVERDVVFDSHLIRVRANAKMADAKYVYLACLSNLARKFLISSAKTATMTTIDQGAIKNCPIILPSLGEQKSIINILSDMDFELESIKNRRAKTQQIKQGMMQELLTGKTRLPVAEM
jgi:type I restriction enzyme S subunit